MFDYLQFFNFIPLNLSIKKIAIFWDIKEKLLFIKSVKTEFIVKHPALFFLPFFKDPAEKLRPHYQICFQSWLKNVRLEMRYFLLK